MKRAAALALLAAGLSAAGYAQTLRTCIPDHPNPPFSMPRGETAWQRVVAQAAQRHGYVVQFMPAPWARCLAGVSAGDYDLILGAEPDDDQADFIALPERAGRRDVSRRLGTVDYVLVRKSTVPAWDFQRKMQPTIVIPRNILAVRMKFSTTRALIRSINYDAERFVALLCQDRADAVVVRRSDLPSLNPTCEIERAQVDKSPALATASVYLGVRKALLRSHPDLAETLWREADKARASNLVGD